MILSFIRLPIFGLLYLLVVQFFRLDMLLPYMPFNVGFVDFVGGFRVQFNMHLLLESCSSVFSFSLPYVLWLWSDPECVIHLEDRLAVMKPGTVENAGILFAWRKFFLAFNVAAPNLFSVIAKSALSLADCSLRSHTIPSPKSRTSQILPTKTTFCHTGHIRKLEQFAHQSASILSLFPTQLTQFPFSNTTCLSPLFSPTTITLKTCQPQLNFKWILLLVPPASPLSGILFLCFFFPSLSLLFYMWHVSDLLRTFSRRELEAIFVYWHSWSSRDMERLCVIHTVHVRVMYCLKQSVNWKQKSLCVLMSTWRPSHCVMLVMFLTVFLPQLCDTMTSCSVCSVHRIKTVQ